MDFGPAFPNRSNASKPSWCYPSFFLNFTNKRLIASLSPSSTRPPIVSQWRGQTFFEGARRPRSTLPSELTNSAPTVLAI